MLWVIDNEKEISEAFKLDLKFMHGNNDISGQLVNYEYCYTKDQMKEKLKVPLKDGEAIFILAHSGYTDKEKKIPFIGGRLFPEFADDMISKFSAAGLTGRMIWFLICSTGKDVEVMAGLLKDREVRKTRLYIPTDFMFVSTTGIPHNLIGYKTSEEADKEVARCHNDYMSIQGAQETGVGVAGAEIKANGDVARIGTKVAEEAVRDTFDPDQKEWSD
jgi:hypothetical protein